MASKYVPAFCTSPPPLDAECVDDDDDDYVDARIGQLHSINGNLDDDTDDSQTDGLSSSFKSKFAISTDVVPSSNDIDQKLCKKEGMTNGRTSPLNDNGDDDDFGSFEGHEGTNGSAPDDIKSEDSPAFDQCIECEDTPGLVPVTDVVINHHEAEIASQDSGTCTDSHLDGVISPDGDGQSKQSSESCDLNLENHPNDDHIKVETDDNIDDDFGSFLNSTITCTNVNVLDQHSEHTFQASDENQTSTSSIVIIESEMQSDEFTDFKEANFLCPQDDFDKNEDESGFGDFAIFDDPIINENDDDNWGAFAQDVRVTELLSEDEQFQDFESAKNNEFEDGFSDIKVQQLLVLAFPLSSSALTTESESETTIEAHVESNLDVWNDLWDVENTNALTYKWSESQTKRILLKSLHVESKNVMVNCSWNLTVPAFASTLTAAPLEPTKASPNEEKPVTTTATNNINSSRKENVLPLVPPVKFDWNSSGLVNPLDDASGMPLDLDFFLTNDVLTSDPNRSTRALLDSLEAEFLCDTNGRISGLPDHQTTSSPSPLVQKILHDSSVKIEMTKSRKSAVLSDKARRVLASLPDLSYMSAKVLMFPIRSQLP